MLKLQLLYHYISCFEFLRYGWLSTLDPKTSEDPSSSTLNVDCLKSKGTHRGYGTDMKTTNEEGTQTVVTREDFISTSVSKRKMQLQLN